MGRHLELSLHQALTISVAGRHGCHRYLPFRASARSPKQPNVRTEHILGKERQGGFLFVLFALIFKSTAKNQLGPLRTKAAETERDEIE